jgi:hypothetical protein
MFSVPEAVQEFTRSTRDSGQCDPTTTSGRATLEEADSVEVLVDLGTLPP